MQLFSYPTYGLQSTGFDPRNSFFRSASIPTLALFLIRATISLYCFTTIIVCYSWLAHNYSTTNLQDVNISSYTLVTGSSGIGQSFSFFTYLTYWSLGFYFLSSSVHTFVYWRTGTTWLHSWPRPLQLMHSFYYTTMTCFPFLVSVVFWGTMYSGPWSALGHFEKWINVSVHGLNSLFAVTEIALPETKPAPWSHISVLVTVLSMYLGLSYLTRWTGGFYVYEWMNPAHGWVSIVLHILCYTGGILAIFLMVQGLVWLRLYATGGERKCVADDRMMKLDDGSESIIASKKDFAIDV